MSFEIKTLPVSGENIDTPYSDTSHSLSIEEINDEHELKENNPDNDSKIYFSVVCDTKCDRIGVSYYEMSTEIIYTSEITDYSIISTLKNKLCPVIIITNLKSNVEWLSVNEINPTIPFKTFCLNYHDFTYESAKKRLKTLQIEDITSQRTLSNNDNILSLMSILDFEKKNMIMSIGGLLSFLLKHNLLHQLEDSSDPISLKSIQPIKLEKSLLVDKATRDHLCIFQNDSVMFHRRSKEGLSIFNILNHTVTKQGSKLMKHWLYNPSQDPDLISYRHNHCEFFLLPSSDDIITDLRTHLKNVKDVNRIYSNLYNVRALVSDWENLYITIQAIIMINQLSNPIVAIFQKIRKAWCDQITQIVITINSIIDFEASRRDGRMTVKAGVSPELDSLRRHYEGLSSFLTKVADDLMKRDELPKAIKAMSIVYFPQLGYLIRIPIESNNHIIDKHSLEGLDFHFQTNENIFYKNSTTRELDEVFGDTSGIINDLQAAIVRELETKVFEVEQKLKDICVIIYELDCLIASSLVAKNYNLLRPKMVKENVLLIKDGRHLLQEQCVDQFIPNNTSMSIGEGDENETPRIHLITGPNSSGKSVYLKQIGIIVYMAHCGFYVPASSAIIGFVDRILTRFETQESCSQNFSTFTIDCSIISSILRTHSERSVILIDEFGKGTCKEDGIALLASVIHFFQKKAITPKVLITTHFYELFTESLNKYIITENEKCAFYKMDIVTKLSTQNVEEVIFLYKLVRGLSINSYGFYCANLAGLPIQIIKRAKEIGKNLIEEKPIGPISHSNLNSDTEYYKKILDGFFGLNFGDEKREKNDIEDDVNQYLTDIFPQETMEG